MKKKKKEERRRKQKKRENVIKFSNLISSMKENATHLPMHFLN